MNEFLVHVINHKVLFAGLYDFNRRTKALIHRGKPVATIFLFAKTKIIFYFQISI